MPEPWIRHLSTLQDAMPPRPWPEVRATIVAELQAAAAARGGGGPARGGAGGAMTTFDEIFDAVDEVPLATASIAQVHVATLRHAPTTDAAGGGGGGSALSRRVVLKVRPQSR